jgi:hypothetical protein
MLSDPKSTAPIVALFPRHATSWLKLFDLACLLRDGGKIRPVVILPTKEMSAYAAVCAGEKIEAIDLSAARDAAIAANGGRLRTALASLENPFARHDRIANCLPVSILRFIDMRRYLQSEHAVFSTALGELAPAAVLVPGDREATPVPAFLKAAADLGIPIVNAGFGSPYPEGVALSRVGFPRFSLEWRHLPPLLNFVAGLLFPRQVYAAPQGWMLFSPAWLTFAHASLGMLADNPWVQGGGLSDYVLQHDARRRQGFLDLGVPARKLVDVGDPSLDLLNAVYRDRETVRARLLASHALPARSELVIFSVPNDAEHGVCDMTTHLHRMRGYFEVLGKSGANVLASLHPKSRREDYAPLAKEFGIALMDERLANALPSADLFVCATSSTVFWARLCGIPTINLDYWKVRDADFVGVAGVENVETAEEFAKALTRHVAANAIDPAFQRDAARLREDNQFDGNSAKRIEQFLLGLAGNRSNERQPARAGGVTA